MEEEPKPGTSINNLLPSEQDTTTNLGTSRVLARPTICKSGAPTQDGSNSSSIPMDNSLTGLTTKLFQLVEDRTSKDKQLLLTVTKREKTSNGRLSISIRLPRQKPRARAMVTATMLRLLVSTQDGGNYSDTKTTWLLTSRRVL